MTAPLFDLYLPQVHMDFATILERVRVAEQAGFHTVWFMDHLAAPLLPDADVLEAWTLAAAVAARTERIRIGHLVLADAMRHPAVLSKQIATVDHISGGRVELGLGWGSVPDELRRFGITDAPGEQRAARLRESLTVVTRLLAGETVDHEGEHLRLRGALQRPTPVQARVPITVGGAGPTLTMPLVRDFADWWNCPSYAADRLDELRPLAGDARISIQRPIALARRGDDVATVEATARRRFEGWGGLTIGSPWTVAEGLRADLAAGVERFIIQFHDFGLAPSVEAFAADVVPLLS
ncbi:MAG: LLM class flavin-dependent oxidoreductase [Actinobacteria bacterium]|nr:LLM class flavin-dependent oxidoreductase [Actinomycetota bacterium]